MSHLNLAIYIFLAVILYFGLGAVFYSPETGFSWLLWFMLATALVLGGIWVLLKREIKKIESKKQEE